VIIVRHNPRHDRTRRSHPAPRASRRRDSRGLRPEARVSAVAAQEALKSERPRCSRQVLGVLDGVTYWSLFATFLAERYAQIGGIERVMTTHPLAHWWTIDDALTVQLKSDTGNLTVDQLVIPGM